MEKKTIYFYLYIIFLAMFSLSFAFMPTAVSAMYNGANGLLYFTGSSFWLGLILAIVSMMLLDINRRRNVKFQEKYKGLKQFGLVNFFKNKPARIFDIVAAVSFFVNVMIQIINVNKTLIFIGISLFIFSFGMHCILNGVNYIYIKSNYR